MKRQNQSDHTAQQLIGTYTKDQMDLIQYGLRVSMNTLQIILCLLIAGILTHKLLEMIIFMIIFATLRQTTGGFHMATLTRCTIVTTSLGILTTWMGVNMTFNTSRYFAMALLVVALVLIYQFANKDDVDNQVDNAENGNKDDRIDKEVDQSWVLKRKQTYRVTAFLVIMILSGATIESLSVYVNVAVISILMVALTLVKYKNNYLFNPYRF